VGKGGGIHSLSADGLKAESQRRDVNRHEKGFRVSPEWIYFLPSYLDVLVKSHHLDGTVKSFKCKACES